MLHYIHITKDSTSSRQMISHKLYKLLDEKVILHSFHELIIIFCIMYFAL